MEFVTLKILITCHCRSVMVAQIKFEGNQVKALGEGEERWMGNVYDL